MWSKLIWWDSSWFDEIQADLMGSKLIWRDPSWFKEIQADLMWSILIWRDLSSSEIIQADLMLSKLIWEDPSWSEEIQADLRRSELIYCLFHVTVQHVTFCYCHLPEFSTSYSLAQIWMKCLNILYVDCCTYILGACKFIEPENTSLWLWVLRSSKTLNGNISWNIKQNDMKICKHVWNYMF